MRPLAWYKSLATPEGRRESGFFIVEGVRAVGQIVAAAPLSIDEILTDGSMALPGNLTGAVRQLEYRQIKSIVASKTPQGIFAVVRLPAHWDAAELPAPAGSRILLCEEIQDPGNIGALIRTAAGFGFDGVILSGKCADPFGPKAVQASAGSVLSIWIRRTPDYLKLLHTATAAGFKLVAADTAGKPSLEWTSAKKLMIALGNEGSGLSKAILDKADFVYRIPMQSQKVESLNVAVSGGVCMFLAAGNASR
jgi:RNA methyltransferase, TrmH family